MPNIGKNQHVVPYKGGWAVRGEGNSKYTFKTGTQYLAIQKALEIALNNRSAVVIHRIDGKIRDKDTYVNNP